MRTKGSCRFETYYKAQFWNERQLAWHDIQKAFKTASEADAFAAGTGYAKTRIMEITEKGRRPLA